ncbi:transcriptional regulator [Pokkaliibacter plantistimulans]|uniref:Transcriptional regulator n=1 Tax=Proteobacteria bacterium 228 TaxID=2083153 RepID=A0A2S5KHP4_9PROT|nr:LysR family transcriptional regulator [Pokkaliibacter plantistimulans]PPC74019.1 transcriptional regulator [Pokkaliibacter plantistimulans]
MSLELFIAVAEERNLTHAARRKHLAVSAVSKRISELEEQVGSPLLVRFARGVSLTPAGQSLLFYARQVHETLKRLDNELSEFASGVKGHIRIHAITSALSQFLPQDITRFAALYPNIRFDVEERVGSAIVRAVAEGKADLGIITDSTRSQGLETVPYRRDELAVVVPAGHPLVSSSRLHFEEILEYELVGPHADSSVHTLISTAAEAAGKPLKLRIRISSFDAICRVVSAGLGIAVLPRSVVQPYRKNYQLRAITLQDPWAKRSLQLIFKKHDFESPTLRTFIDSLTACEE